LIDPQGRNVPDYQDPKSFGTYEKFAQDSHLALQKINPQLAQQHRWGGYFSGAIGKGGVYGAMDLMHQDVAGGNARMAAGQWETGLSPQWRRAWGVTDANAGIGSRASELASAPQTVAVAAGGGDSVFGRPPSQATINAAAENRQAINMRAAEGLRRLRTQGKLSVDVTAPKGTTVQAGSGGLWKHVEVHRRTTQARAAAAPASNVASVQGAGTAL
jgi:hypothetical protein